MDCCVHRRWSRQRPHRAPLATKFCWDRFAAPVYLWPPLTEIVSNGRESARGRNWKTVASPLPSQPGKPSEGRRSGGQGPPLWAHGRTRLAPGSCGGACIRPSIRKSADERSRSLSYYAALGRDIAPPTNHVLATFKPRISQVHSLSDTYNRVALRQHWHT